MAEAEAELRIGAEVSCSDGYCGKVTRLVVDPAARTVAHLVIEPKHRQNLASLFRSTWSTLRPLTSGCAVPSRSSTGSIPPRRPTW